ncbi:MAG TPA: hypothetical protein PLV59_04220 [Candidatus Dojkabacteria bacterium]|nr:hypothetical protein [Candidatus Dojkabacteria bacterium]
MKKTLGIISLLVLLAVSGVLLALKKDDIVSYLTPQKDCTPFNMLVNKEVKDKVVISWETKGKCTGVVKFGRDVESLDYWLSSKFENKKNVVTIDTQTYKNIRYFVIVSNNEVYGLDGKAVSID